MKILHIAAHLGGGVGKAHSAVCAADDRDISRHYLLLEEPRDTRFADAIRAAGAEITILNDRTVAQRLLEQADIVQIEYWNHPRLYAFLCGVTLPAARTLIWCHISGLFAPLIPPGLMSAAHRFLFTSACSWEAAAVRELEADRRAALSVVNSGFGFADTAAPTRARAGRIGTLGTIDFTKLSPDFFAVIDHAAPDCPVSVWGSVEPDGEVRRRAAAMHRPEAVHFHGHCDDPQAALREIGIFLYLLQPRHFGTAENALIEAMSLGCVPLVFDNPAERAIVTHGETGFIETTVESAAARLRWMLAHPDALMAMGQEAARHVARTHSARKTAADFAAIYRAMQGETRRTIDFRAILGATPADWFLATQDGAAPSADQPGAARKGTLHHFLHCFPEDASLRALLQG
ncbi:MAG: glycosyltransferase family 4 protein [Sphingobium sp.]|jgi:hypothetical protein|nr:glycosyltransferase family 4 protein [Sphingobium sp.]MCI1270714.1 glycosyltransferase family 4 protein [Sphingobium sp.]MCI1755158.1 glycosyltransferase family 4 protein [Sphingobium sp.]MCI2053469.1 glycosyltransferase family 4 protein [Sphingobium sp.]